MDSIGSHDDAIGQAGNSSAVQAEQTPPSSVLGHGIQNLPAVTVDTYNEELRDEEGFVGDRASGRAFRAILDDWARTCLELAGRRSVRRHTNQRHLEIQARQGVGGQRHGRSGTRSHRHRGVRPRARHRSAQVPASRRLARHRAHRDRRRFEFKPSLPSRDGPGRRSCLRAKALPLNCARSEIIRMKRVCSARYSSRRAGCWRGHDAIIAVDIGGTNLRVGIVELRMKKGDVSKAAVWKLQQWRHPRRQADT